MSEKLTPDYGAYIIYTTDIADRVDEKWGKRDF